MYRVLYNENIGLNASLIRIEPTDIKLTLGEIFSSLSNVSWINEFDKEYMRNYFTVRTQETIDYISKNILAEADDEITKDTGEIVVSELSRIALVNEKNYLDIPLAELFKSQAFGNDGFDFFSVNLNKIILFGEAKYNSRQNAYGNAFEQIVRFENQKQDVSDLKEIAEFCCDDSLANHTKGQKGFIAAFASKSTATDRIIRGIQNNSDFKKLVGFEELICVAVNI
jgi:hypothetical protein